MRSVGLPKHFDGLGGFTGAVLKAVSTVNPPKV
jgi:hypothetical protein